MGTPTASPRALVAVALMLGGGVLAALGLFFFGFGVYSIALGYGLGHAGGWSMVATGLICAGIGIPAVRKGRKIYDAIAS